MKIAIMQPYIFPYIGYFQLVNYADSFVLYDDVNYIKGGYINRNTILYDGKPKRFTLPVLSASPNKKISELSFAGNLRKPLELIRHAYSRAPNSPAILKLVEDVLMAPEQSVTSVCENAIKSVFEYLDLEVELIRSSSLEYDRTLNASDKVIAISKLLGGSNYTNSAGGKHLYHKEYFSRHHCELSFIEMKAFRYQQGKNEFVPNLSIIDILMWREKNEVIEALNSYSIC